MDSNQRRVLQEEHRQARAGVMAVCEACSGKTSFRGRGPLSPALQGLGVMEWRP